MNKMMTGAALAVGMAVATGAAQAQYFTDQRNWDSAGSTRGVYAAGVADAFITIMNMPSGTPNEFYIMTAQCIMNNGWTSRDLATIVDKAYAEKPLYASMSGSDALLLAVQPYCAKERAAFGFAPPQ